MTMPGNQSTVRVLLVGAQPDAMERTAASFRLRGQCVRTACDAPEAIEYSKVFLPHLIILDTEIQTTSLEETVRGLRSAVLTGRSSIVAVTGCEQPARKRRGAEAGCDLCIPKVDFDILDQLMWLSREPDRLREDSRQLARRQASGFMKFVDVSMDMVSTLLDVAIDEEDPSLRSGYLAKARETQRTVAGLVQNRSHERSDLVTALDKLGSRHGHIVEISL